eukprot:3959579-Amphidinium_carterae.1
MQQREAGKRQVGCEMEYVEYERATSKTRKREHWSGFTATQQLLDALGCPGDPNGVVLHRGSRGQSKPFMMSECPTPHKKSPRSMETPVACGPLLASNDSDFNAEQTSPSHTRKVICTILIQ